MQPSPGWNAGKRGTEWSVSSDFLGKATEGESQVRRKRCRGEKGGKGGRACQVQALSA